MTCTLFYFLFYAVQEKQFMLNTSCVAIAKVNRQCKETERVQMFRAQRNLTWGYSENANWSLKQQWVPSDMFICATQ